MLQILSRSEAVPEIFDEVLEYLPSLKTIWMQIGVMNQKGADKARRKGIEAVQNSYPKMGIQRLSGESGRYSVHTGFFTSRIKPWDIL